MPRYIDADKIKQELLAKDAELGKPKDLDAVLKSTGIFHALIHIQLAETEDVAPVIHSHWIEEEDCTAVTDIPWSMRSACGSYSLKLPYCAFCGAKMDEEE